MNMKDISWENQFDGVWAMASLLHLEKKDFPHILKKVINSVKEDGYLFISLKQGMDSGYDEKGRFFSYYQKEELENILKEMNVENISFSANKDTLGRDLSWISFIAQKNSLKLLHQNKNDNNILKRKF